MEFLTVISPYMLFAPNKKVIPITRIHYQLCWQPQLRDRALRRWEAWAVFPPTNVFSPGQVWGVFARNKCRQLASTLPVLHLPDGRRGKSLGTLYNLALFMRIKLWSQAEDNKNAGLPLSLNSQCAIRNLHIGTRNFQIDVANLHTFIWKLFISFLIISLHRALEWSLLTKSCLC